MRNVIREKGLSVFVLESKKWGVCYGTRLFSALAFGVLGVFSATGDPIYGPDYGPTDFTLPGAFATTNSYPVPATGTVRYVAPDVPRGSANSGTSFSSPWNLYDALTGGKAQDDTTLVLSGGVYRVAQDTASRLYVSKRLTIQPYLDQQVWLKGSRVIEGASFAQAGPVWYTPWTLCFTNILQMGEITHYYIDEEKNPISDDGDMAFDRNGRPLRQVPSLAELGPGCFCIDFAAQRLYVGDPPAEICPLEAAACTNGLLVSSTAKAVTLRGLGVAHFAGRGIHLGSVSGRVENCVSVWNGNVGLSMWMATGSVVRGCTFACNGQNGASGGGLDARFEGNLYAYNNVEKFAANWNAAGHKTTSFSCSNMVFRGNVFERNYAMGLWLDCSVYNALVCDNIMRFNRYYGLHVEISHGNSVAFNTLYGNGSSDIFVLNAPHNRIYNNTLSEVLGNGLRVQDQTRRNSPGETTFSDDPESAAAGNMFDTYTNHFANNLLARVSPSSGYPLFRAQDTAWPGQASFGAADAMVTLSENNLYSRPDTFSPLVSARADLTATATNYTDLALFRQHYPGFETGSVSWEGGDPFFRDAEARDYRPKAAGAAVGAAAPLPADLAARCGRPVNVRYAGALAPWDEGWWRFDETSGLALDCVSTNSGTLGGTGSLPQRVPGKGRNALNFQGTNYVSFTTSLSHLNGALTVSAWVRPLAPPTGVGRIIANTFNYNAKRGWLLGCQYGSTDRLEFQFYSPGGTLASVSCYNFFRDWSNRWVHVAGVFKPAVSGSDGYLALYTNGVPAGTPVATAFTTIGTTSTNLRIGLRADNLVQGMWSGLIDEVRVFGAVLNAGEIAALMPIAEGRWRFDETDGLNKAYDSVYANTGSVVNATYTDAGKGGRALSFNGSNSRVDFTTNLAHLTNAITVSAWVKPITPPKGVGRVIANTFLYGSGGNASRRGWLLGCQYGSSDVMQFHVSSPTGGIVTATCTGFFRDWSNRWVHVAGVFRPGESVALYTNGVLAGTPTPTTYTSIGVTNRNLRIGTRAEDTTQGMWSGLIDEVRVFDGVLSSQELVSACAAAPNCPPEIIRVTASPSSCFAGDTVLLGVDASDPDPGDRIARVEFYADGALVGSCAREPYRLLWKSQGNAGTRVVTAKVYDTRESVTASGVPVELKALMTSCEAGHWRFDETSGIYSYDSADANRGTNYNGVARVPGRMNGALSFDGTNDYVGFGTNLAHLSGALTVAAWVKPNRPPSNISNYDKWGRVIANTFHYDANTSMRRGWLLGNPFGATDLLQFHVSSPAGGMVYATCYDFFRDWSNKWVHVTGVFKPAASGSDGYVALYTNGVIAASNTTAFTAIGTTNNNFKIGMRADQPNQGMWSGLIDEVRVFGAVLPQDELDALCSAPAAQWRFEEADGYPYATNSLAADLFHGTVYAPTHRTADGFAGSRALTFDGLADRVTFTTNLAYLSGALTVSAWVKPDRPPSVLENQGRVIANTYNYDKKRGWLLGCSYGSSDQFQFFVHSPTGGPSAAATCYNFFRDWSNRWVHVAGVFRPGEEVALYTNGMLAAHAPTTFTEVGYTNTSLRIGMRSDVTGQGMWSGLIDEVRLYEGALPLFAVQALSDNEPASLPGILSVQTEPEGPTGSRRATILLVR